MGLVNTAVRFAASLLRLATAGPAFDLPSRLDLAAKAGPAPSMSPKSRPDGLQQLQARRLALLTEAQKHRHLRRSKATSLCEAELRRVTHDILRSRINA